MIGIRKRLYLLVFDNINYSENDYNNIDTPRSRKPKFCFCFKLCSRISDFPVLYKYFLT